MKGSDQSRLGAKVFLIAKQLKEGVPGTVKQNPAQHLFIDTPKLIQLIGNGKDHMEVMTTQKAGFLFLKPALHLDECTLRAHPVLARIVPLTLYMTIRTGLHVTPQDCRSAGDQRPRRLLNMAW
jgi:hypothetical protein